MGGHCGEVRGACIGDGEGRPRRATTVRTGASASWGGPRRPHYVRPVVKSLGGDFPGSLVVKTLGF